MQKLTMQQIDALARIGLGIFGVANDGHIRTNVPNVYHLFVDFYGVSSQEEILPILKRVIQLDQEKATSIVTTLNQETKNWFRQYLLDGANNDGKTLLAIAVFMRNIRFDPNYIAYGMAPTSPSQLTNYPLTSYLKDESILDKIMRLFK